MLRNCANLMLAWSHQSDTAPPTVSNNWPKQFLRQHLQYSIQKQKSLTFSKKPCIMLKTFSNGLKDFIKNMTSMEFNKGIAGIWIKVASGLVVEKINGLL